MASSTTNDKEIARNPHPPKGLGRDGTISLLLLLVDVWASTRRRASIWSPSRSQHTSSYLWQGVLDQAGLQPEYNKNLLYLIRYNLLY